MSAIGNLLWFFTFGLLLALQWWLTGLIMLCSVIGIPWAKACFVIGQMALFPFGKEAISRRDLKGTDDIGTSGLGMLGNVIWFFIGGFWLALGHCFAALVCAATVIGIPFAIQHLKLAGIALAPIGKTIVSKEVAATARAASAHAFVGQHRGGWRNPEFAQEYLAANPRRTAVGAGVGLLIFLALAFIVVGALSSKSESSRRAAPTPEQREAEYKQKADDAKAAEAARKAVAEADAKRQAAGDAMTKQEEEAKRAAAKAEAVAKRQADANQTATTESQPAMGTGEDSHPTDLSVSDAAAVFAAYERNEVQADNQIKGKWLAIKGSVNKIGKDILDTPYVALSTKSHIFSVQCMFTKADENILSQLQPEQIVVIAGKCDGKMGNVLIRQCWFYDADRKQREEAQRQAAIRQQAAIERAQAEKERKAAIEAAKWRTWTDASGAHKMEAKFSGMTAGNVKLTKRDGSVLTLPLEKLSDEDQEWIKKRK